MSGPLKVQIVERARALIADEQHWCRGHLAQDENGVAVFPTSANAVKRCGLGAVIAAAYEFTHDFDAAHSLGHTPCAHITATRRSFTSTTQGVMLRCLRYSMKLLQRAKASFAGGVPSPIGAFR